MRSSHRSPQIDDVLGAYVTTSFHSQLFIQAEGELAIGTTVTHSRASTDCTFYEALPHILKRASFVVTNKLVRQLKP